MAETLRLRVHHTTRYTYDRPVPYALQQLRVVPKSRAGQSVVRWDMQIENGQIEAEFEDHNANLVKLVSLAPDATSIAIHSEGEVDVTDTGGVVRIQGGFVPLWLFRHQTPLTKPGPQVRALIQSLGSEDELITRLHTLSTAILSSVTYELGQTNIASSAEDVLSAGHGVCQDHAHVFLSAARHMGVPARYVSGYLMMNDRVDQDASHAWTEAHIDGLGWVGFDVSNGISPDGRYVRVATGLDYTEAAPVTGIRVGDSNETLSVSLQVQQ